jgi:hypothetical protein
MLGFLKTLGSFLRSVFSESDGTGSWGRCGSALIVVFTLGWVTYVVIRTHAIPDLMGPLAFLTGGSGSLYGANKLITAFSKKDPSPPIPQ